MLRDEDEFDGPEYDCPTCGHSFHSFGRLDDHMAEHEGPERCKTCGQTKRGPYHRCP